MNIVCFVKLANKRISKNFKFVRETEQFLIRQFSETNLTSGAIG
jgi:hypothetical protein